jgi:hypothetical protein
MNQHEFAEYVQERYKAAPNSRMDRFGKEFMQSERFPIRVVMQGGDLSWVEANIGTQFGSTVDYGRTYNQITSGKMSEDELVAEVRQRVASHPRYINHYDKHDETVVCGLAVVLTESGYSIRADPEQIIQL